MSTDLLKAASAALVLLHSIQEQTEGAHNMPWPEIDALEMAVTEANERAKVTGKVSKVSKVTGNLTVAEFVERIQRDTDTAKQVRFVGPDDVLLKLDGFEDRADRLLVVFTQGDYLYWQEAENA